MEVIMEESQNQEKVQLSTEQLVDENQKKMNDDGIGFYNTGGLL